jgi:hypothetical protein
MRRPFRVRSESSLGFACGCGEGLSVEQHVELSMYPQFQDVRRDYRQLHLGSLMIRVVILSSGT